MADMKHGLKLAQDGQQWLTEVHAFLDDPSIPKEGRVAAQRWAQRMHDAASQVFVHLPFDTEATAAIFPGVGGAHTNEGGSGGGKQAPPPQNPN